MSSLIERKFMEELSFLSQRDVKITTTTGKTYTGYLTGIDPKTLNLCLANVKNEQGKEIDKMFSSDQASKFFRPMEDLLPELPKIIVNDRIARLVRSGSEFCPDHYPVSFSPDGKEDSKHEKKPDVYRIFDSQGKLIAFATKKDEKNSLHPFLVFESKNTSP